MTTVLLTGFEPFGGDSANPSGDAVRLVAAGWDRPEVLVTAVLPVAFGGAARELERLIDEHCPDVVLAAGLAGGRSAIAVERVALNLIDARIPDNADAQPIDAPSVPGAPPAHFSSLPVKAIVRDVTATGIPVVLSNSAGTFVCNHVFFVAAERAASAPGMRAGFVHVPWADGQAAGDVPTLPLADIARALTTAIRTTLDTERDVRDTGGSLY